MNIVQIRYYFWLGSSAVIKITRETDYGIVLTAFMAAHEQQAFSAASLARQRGLPLPMVSKILKLLTRAGLLRSQRGVRGGYSLSRSPDQISVADIIDALEGPIAITECSADTPPDCQSHCSVSGHWYRINQTVRDALANISLRQMSEPPVREATLVFFKDPASVPGPIANSLNPSS